MPNRNRAGVAQVKTAALMRDALELRKMGATFEAIGAALRISTSYASDLVIKGLKETIRPAADELRELEGLRLDALQMAMWPLALGNPANNVPPDLNAARAVLRVMQRRAALFGLDAPTKITGDVMMRQITEQAAKDAGLDPDLVMAEAERILQESGF